MIVVVVLLVPMSARAATPETIEVYAETVTSIQVSYWGHKVMISLFPPPACPPGTNVTDSAWLVANDGNDEEVARKVSIATAALLSGKRVRLMMRCDESATYDHRPVIIGIGILQ
jgi:hypothetical protein